MHAEFFGCWLNGRLAFRYAGCRCGQSCAVWKSLAHVLQNNFPGVGDRSLMSRDWPRKLFENPLPRLKLGLPLPLGWNVMFLLKVPGFGLRKFPR